VLTVPYKKKKGFLNKKKKAGVKAKKANQKKKKKLNQMERERENIVNRTAAHTTCRFECFLYTCIWHTFVLPFSSIHFLLLLDVSKQIGLFSIVSYLFCPSFIEIAFFLLLSCTIPFSCI
jgi:hypothetical protein